MTIPAPVPPVPLHRDRSVAAWSSQRRDYSRQGFLGASFTLGDASPLADLCTDAALFDAMLAAWRAEGVARTPYLFTPAIERVAHDPAILSVVEALLGTSAWVVWGPNLLRETPHASARWHVDLESRFWPSVSVAIGVSGCSERSAIWCLPGTQDLERTPFSSGNAGDTERVLRYATSLLPSVGDPQQIAGFGDGRFFVLNARTWHRAAPGTTDRLILFLHYQRADALRIPLQLDYRRHRWSREPSPYRAAPGTTPVTTTASSPIRERVLALVTRWLP